MLARHDRISGALAGFAFGVIFTIFMIAVVYLVGRASAGSGGPNPTPRAYPTLTTAPTLTTEPTFTSVPTNTAVSTPTPAITPAAVAVVPPTDTPPPPTPAPMPTSTFTPMPSSPTSLPAAAPPAAAAASPAPSASLQAAIAVVNDKGYQVIDASHFDSGGPLQVLIGRMVTAAGEPAEYAFFFVNGQFLGRDLPQSSASISVAAQTGDTVVIRYALYRPTDPECCPTGGYQDVPYQWDGTRLNPLAPYPTYLADAPLSRR